MDYVESIFPILNDIYENRVKQLLAQVGFDISKPGKFGKGTMYLIYITEEVRQNLKIDDILCLYLIDVSENSIVNFYKMVGCFVQLLRNCIN